MNFIQATQNWTQGDIIQGKWMIGIAVFIILPISVFLIKSIQPLQKGMLIPISLLFLMNVGYGGYLLYSKQKCAEQRTTQFQINAEQTLKTEITKINAANKSYSFTKYAWAGLLIVSVVSFFIFNKEYFQGLSLGFTIMFLGMFLIDSFLHNRLELYIKTFIE